MLEEEVKKEKINNKNKYLPKIKITTKKQKIANQNKPNKNMAHLFWLVSFWLIFYWLGLFDFCLFVFLGWLVGWLVD